MSESPTRVLITGAHGLVGNVLYRHLAAQPEHYDVFGLDRRLSGSERVQTGDFTPLPADRFTQAELGDFDALRTACRGIDCVVHLAADADQDSEWASVRDNNVIGTYNVFEACRQAGVGRVIFASSVMVNFGYRQDELYGAFLHATLPDTPSIDPGEFEPLPATDPTRPTTLYAASKVWGEALAHHYSFNYDMHCLCVRIGWVVGEDRPPPKYSGSLWLSFRDCGQFFQRCIDASTSLRHDTFYAVSGNRFRFLDLAHARRILGYVPQDGEF